MSGRSKSKYNQSSKSASSKKRRNERDIVSTPPHSEFPAITSTFSGLGTSNYIIHGFRKFRDVVSNFTTSLHLYSGNGRTLRSVIAFMFLKPMNYVIFIALFSTFLGASNTYATDSYITISLNGVVNLNLLGGNHDGVFGDSSAATASIETNNYTGYTFTIRGNNPNGDLVGANDANHVIPSIQVSSPITADQFNTNTYNNKWGFRPSHLSTNTGTITNTGYISAPTTTNYIEIDKTSSANEGNLNEYTLAVAARVNDQTPNDHYTGTFTLAATGNATPYHIAYTDDVQNMPSMTLGETTGASINISSQIPYKNGYIFLGWCSVPTTGSTCSGDTYQPGGSYTLDPTTDNSVTLHAMWGSGYNTFDAAFAAAGKTKSGSYYAMQDMNESICRTILVGTSGTLVDTRDNRTYAVSKYADNNCWMHQNLELTFYTGTNGSGYATNKSTGAKSIANNVTTLNSSNTDITSGVTYNVSSFYATQSKAATTSGDSNFSWQDDGNDGGHSFSWVAYNSNQAYAIPAGTQNQYGQNEYTTSSTGTPEQRAGNLYNWTMATLGSGKNIATDGTNAPDSICPKGWQLPVNSGNKSFYNLLDIYYTGAITSGNPQTDSTIANPSALTIMQNIMRSNSLDFVVSGAYFRSNGTIYGRVTEGSFWSATVYSNGGAYNLSSYFTGFYLQKTNNRGHGFAVRCVAR